MLIFRPELTRSVGIIGGCRHLHEADLSDLHAEVQADRQRRDVGQLEGEMAAPARVDEASGRVTVLIHIFGRSTQVELEYWQIEAV